jgi:small subunit ribosomal protein S21
VALEVFVRGRDVDGALRLLRRKLSKEAVFRTLQDKVAYATPGERTRRKRGRAESRRRKAKARWAAKNKAQVTER